MALESVTAGKLSIMPASDTGELKVTEDADDGGLMEQRVEGVRMLSITGKY